MVEFRPFESKSNCSHAGTEITSRKEAMKKLMLGLLLLVPAMLLAQSAFDGTWRFSPQSGQFGGKHDTYLLKDGVYRCDSCVPEINVKADGKDHKRTGSPYSDAVSVRAVGDNTIEIITKKGGKVVGKSKDTVSPDGNTLTTEWSFVGENGQERNGRFVSKRVSPAPEGANKVSGSWRGEKMESASENIMLVTYKVTEDGLSMTQPSGESYTAKFDGKDYPYKGDPGTTSVSLKKIDDNTIEETDKRDGTVISVARMTISPDGHTMKLEGEDKLHSTTFKFEAAKQ